MILLEVSQRLFRWGGVEFGSSIFSFRRYHPTFSVTELFVRERLVPIFGTNKRVEEANRMERTYYEILGVERDATTEEIREAYREIARVYHPDSNFYDEIIDESLPTESVDKFKQITSAYNTLVNDEKRKKYNDTLPPELAGWEAQEKESSHDDWVRKKARSSGVYAMGQFGNLNGNPKKAPPPNPEEEQPIYSVAEYAAIPRSSLVSQALVSAHVNGF